MGTKPAFALAKALVVDWSLATILIRMATDKRESTTRVSSMKNKTRLWKGV